ETMLDPETEELLNLAGDIDLEEQITAGAGDETDTTEDDNDEGWVDEREDMTEGELNVLEQSVQPVRRLLTKLRKISFAIKNSTTIILPQWLSTLQELELAERMMPRDVRTRWNSTFDMLNFAVEHISPINTITGDRNM
ncbi:hypothetical protein M413DRAFT_56205, partial [Hebeloma cylindrosporum]